MSNTLDVNPSPSGSACPPSASASSTGSPLPPRIVNAVVVREVEGTIERVVGFALVFSTPLDRVRAENVDNYAVFAIVPEFSNGDRLKVLLSAVIYNQETLAVSLVLAGRNKFQFGGQIVVNSSPPDGITDLSGTFLDGSGNGVPGSPAVLTILPGASGITL